jgi:hypothetical protein
MDVLDHGWVEWNRIWALKLALALAQVIVRVTWDRECHSRHHSDVNTVRGHIRANNVRQIFFV